jgi:hypothetical protein
LLGTFTADRDAETDNRLEEQARRIFAAFDARESLIRLLALMGEALDAPANPPAVSEREQAKGMATAGPKLGAPQRYDPDADDAYLAKYAHRTAGQTAQDFEAQNGDDPGTVEKTQARVRARRQK